jgi:hypothetical protein
MLDVGRQQNVSKLISLRDVLYQTHGSLQYANREGVQVRCIWALCVSITVGPESIYRDLPSTHVPPAFSQSCNTACNDRIGL